MRAQYRLWRDPPSLAELTRVAIERLREGGDKGFFLIIESASIDKQSHSRNPCGSIGEIEQLEEALAVALAHAARYENTMVLVTRRSCPSGANHS